MFISSLKPVLPALRWSLIPIFLILAHCGSETPTIKPQVDSRRGHKLQPISSKFYLGKPSLSAAGTSGVFTRFAKEVSRSYFFNAPIGSAPKEELLVPGGFPATDSKSLLFEHSAFIAPDGTYALVVVNNSDHKTNSLHRVSIADRTHQKLADVQFSRLISLQFNSDNSKIVLMVNSEDSGNHIFVLKSDFSSHAKWREGDLVGNIVSPFFLDDNTLAVFQKDTNNKTLNLLSFQVADDLSFQPAVERSKLSAVASNVDIRKQNNKVFIVLREDETSYEVPLGNIPKPKTDIEPANLPPTGPKIKNSLHVLDLATFNLQSLPAHGFEISQLDAQGEVSAFVSNKTHQCKHDKQVFDKVIAPGVRWSSDGFVNQKWLFFNNSSTGGKATSNPCDAQFFKKGAVMENVIQDLAVGGTQKQHRLVYTSLAGQGILYIYDKNEDAKTESFFKVNLQK